MCMPSLSQPELQPYPEDGSVCCAGTAGQLRFSSGDMHPRTTLPSSQRPPHLLQTYPPSVRHYFLHLSQESGGLYSACIFFFFWSIFSNHFRLRLFLPLKISGSLLLERSAHVKGTSDKYLKCRHWRCLKLGERKPTEKAEICDFALYTFFWWLV